MLLLVLVGVAAAEDGADAAAVIAASASVVRFERDRKSRPMREWEMPPKVGVDAPQQNPHVHVMSSFVYLALHASACSRVLVDMDMSIPRCRIIYNTSIYYGFAYTHVYRHNI